MQNKFKSKPISAAVTALAASCLLAACGGSGSPTVQQVAAVVGPVAASPFLSGTVKLTCADGVTTAMGSIGADSTYSVTPPANCSAPYLIEVLSGVIQPIGGSATVQFTPETYFPLKTYVGAADADKGINAVTTMAVNKLPAGVPTEEAVKAAKEAIASAVGLTSADLGKDYATKPELLALSTALVKVIQSAALDTKLSLAEISKQMGLGLIKGTVNAGTSLDAAPLTMGTQLNALLTNKATSTADIDTAVTTMKALAVEISDQNGQSGSTKLTLADLGSNKLASKLSACAVGASSATACNDLTKVLATNAGATAANGAKNSIDLQVSKMAFDAKNSVSSTDKTAADKKNAIDLAAEQQRKTLNDAYKDASTETAKAIALAQGQAAVNATSTQLVALVKDTTADASKILVSGLAITASAVKAAQTQVTTVADLDNATKIANLSTSVANAAAALSTFVVPTAVGTLSLDSSKINTPTGAQMLAAVMLAVQATAKQAATTTALTTTQIAAAKALAETLATNTNAALTKAAVFSAPPVVGESSAAISSAAIATAIAEAAKRIEGNVTTTLGTVNFSSPPTPGEVSASTTTTAAATTTTTGTPTTTTGRATTTTTTSTTKAPTTTTTSTTTTQAPTTTTSTTTTQAPTTTTSTTTTTTTTTTTLAFAGVCQVQFGTVISYVTAVPSQANCSSKVLAYDATSATVTVFTGTPLAARTSVAFNALAACDAFGAPPGAGATTAIPCKNGPTVAGPVLVIETPVTKK